MLPDPAVQKTGAATPYGDLQPVERMARRRPQVGIAQIAPFRLRGVIGWLFWLTYHILILDTIRARFTALINWAALFLFREPPLRLDVSAKRRQAPD
jgi:hypothetical protein